MSALAEYQRQFVAILMNPDTPAPVGFKVYRNTVIKGLVDVLAANHPTVERLVGEEWFHASAREYVLQHLPQETPLALYGANFSEFLRSLLAVTQGSSEVPYLSDVAQLDRCWTEVHFAADAPCLQAAQLAVFAPQALSELQLKLHPTVRIGTYPHSAVSIWQSNRPPAIPPETLEVDGSDEAVLITRLQGAVIVTPLTQAGFAFMQQLQAGHTLGTAAVQLLELDAHADIATLLANCIKAGAFVEL